MRLRSRKSIYFLSIVIGGACGLLFPFVLYGFARVIPETIGKQLFKSVLYASIPAFRFGSAIGAHMGALLVLVIWYWMIVGIVASLGSVWLYFMLLHKTGGTKKHWLNVALVLCVVLSGITVSRVTRNYRVFRRYVLKPIPKSVKKIRMHRPWEGSGHRYVMRFKISKAGVKRLLVSRPFEEFDQVSYNNGTLVWRHTDPLTGLEGLSQTEVLDMQMKLVEEMSLYTPYSGERGPEWFKPNDWSNPKVYWFHEKYGRFERSHEQVLIFSEELAEAYFVEYLSGTW